MTSNQVLPPCPFCEGPPSVIVANGLYPYGAAPVQDDYGADGLIIDAYVFCHECGAEGPRHEAEIYDEAGYWEAEAAGVRLWVERTNRNRGLYDGAAACGLNHYPRASS